MRTSMVDYIIYAFAKAMFGALLVSADISYIYCVVLRWQQFPMWFALLLTGIMLVINLAMIRCIKLCNEML